MNKLPSGLARTRCWFEPWLTITILEKPSALYFFVENQPEGINVHEKLEPQISAQIIISHVTDGLDLANKHHLPPAIKDGIAQHQGTDLVKYFYYQALKAAEEKEGQVDKHNFQYPWSETTNQGDGHSHAG